MNKLTSLLCPSEYNFESVSQLRICTCLCRALCSPACVSVERAPICRWAGCTPAEQYLVSSFNYRSACVFISTLLTKDELFCSPSHCLWTIHLLRLSRLSFSGMYRWVPYSPQHAWNALPTCWRKKLSPLPCLPNSGPFTKYCSLLIQKSHLTANMVEFWFWWRTAVYFCIKLRQ